MKLTKKDVEKIICWLEDYQTELYENYKACCGENKEYMETSEEIEELLIK